MAAGYSGTPLVRKLGLRPGWRVAVVGGPSDLTPLLGRDLPDGLEIVNRLDGPVDAVWMFLVWRRELDLNLARALACLPPDGTLWLSWPKRASGVPTDVTENVLREVVLPTGWVDIKVAAIDETWSGLRFALRRELRS
jgi:hypothetical protein